MLTLAIATCTLILGIAALVIYLRWFTVEGFMARYEHEQRRLEKRAARARQERRPDKRAAW